MTWQLSLIDDWVMEQVREKGIENQSDYGGDNVSKSYKGSSIKKREWSINSSSQFNLKSFLPASPNVQPSSPAAPGQLNTLLSLLLV